MTRLFTMTMEFKQEELVQREMEISTYLMKDLSLKRIAVKTGLSKKIVAAHLLNMMEKLKAVNIDELIKLIKNKER